MAPLLSGKELCAQRVLASRSKLRPFQTFRTQRLLVASGAKRNGWDGLGEAALTYATGLAAAGLVISAGSALAAEKVADFPASGILFRDSVETLAIDDPEVKGVTIYISDFKRNLKDKISNMGNEPSSASVTCAVTGPIEIRNPGKIKGQGGEDVFSEKKGLGFIQNKTLHVRRVFDEAHKTLLYVAYSTRLTNDNAESPGRYKTSVCALPVSAEVAPVAKTSDNDKTGLFAPAKNDST